MIIVMPEHMTEERKDTIRRLGAELVLCSAEGSFAEAVAIRDDIAQDANCFNPDQFSNPLNVECHEQTTGQELLAQLPHGAQIDAFVAGVGTGGSLMGVGNAIRKHFPNAMLVAVEPAEAAVMSGGKAANHAIYGIGDGFIPPLVSNGDGGLHPLIGRVEVVRSEDAIHEADRLRSDRGLCVGISSGANILAAKRLRSEGMSVATLLPDGYWKYRSHGLCEALDPACAFHDQCPRAVHGTHF